MRVFTSISVALLVLDMLVREAHGMDKKGIPGREYLVDNSRGVGRRFDGVGAISGGGVRMIINYLCIPQCNRP